MTNNCHFLKSGGVLICRLYTNKSKYQEQVKREYSKTKILQVATSTLKIKYLFLYLRDTILMYCLSYGPDPHAF